MECEMFGLFGILVKRRDLDLETGWGGHLEQSCCLSISKEGQVFSLLLVSSSSVKPVTSHDWRLIAVGTRSSYWLPLTFWQACAMSSHVHLISDGIRGEERGRKSTEWKVGFCFFFHREEWKYIYSGDVPMKILPAVSSSSPSLWLGWHFVQRCTTLFHPAARTSLFSILCPCICKPAVLLS